MSDNPILIASDHAGVTLKAELQKALTQWKWLDLGPKTAERVDYPDFAAELATRIARGEASRGVLICGSGIGMSISANKIAGIRAALAENPSAARLSREHNNANVLCLGARFVAPEYAAEIARAWLTTPFSPNTPDGARHAARVEKIAKIESRFCQKVGSSQ